ncbi:MAG: DUF5652 family protein [Candidatus Paceibacterota bacterium]|jgi:methionyl-tRNA synthetase
MQDVDKILLTIQNDPWIFYLLLGWITIWKGIALWKASALKSKPWFIALLVINTMGILEILYIFFLYKVKWFSKKQPDQGIQ